MKIKMFKIGDVVEVKKIADRKRLVRSRVPVKSRVARVARTKHSDAKHPQLLRLEMLDGNKIPHDFGGVYFKRAR